MFIISTTMAIKSLFSSPTELQSTTSSTSMCGEPPWSCMSDLPSSYTTLSQIEMSTAEMFLTELFTGKSPSTLQRTTKRSLYMGF